MSTWLQILGTGVTAAVLTQGIAWLKDVFRDRAKVKIDRRYLALRLAVVLERFAIQCAHQIGTIENEIGQAIDSSPSVSLSIPVLKLPQGDDWRWIDTELASEVFAIFPQIDFSKGAISWLFEVADAFSAAAECQYQLALRGLECWHLAVKLRSKYEVAPAKFDLGEWDFVQILTKHTKKHVR